MKRHCFNPSYKWEVPTNGVLGRSYLRKKTIVYLIRSFAHMLLVLHVGYHPSIDAPWKTWKITSALSRNAWRALNPVYLLRARGRWKSTRLFFVREFGLFESRDKSTWDVKKNLTIIFGLLCEEPSVIDEIRWLVFSYIIFLFVIDLPIVVIAIIFSILLRIFLLT